jgi:serine/threonine-protein kinase
MLDDILVTEQVTRAGDGGGSARIAGWSVAGYTGLKPLGSGGFGDVVLARHDESGTLVAIKYLRGSLLSDTRFARMFRDEAAVLASLDDPHVVRLYEYVEAPAGAAIVMELVDGVSLRQILARAGGTSPEAALVVLRGSLLGLAAAHARGVVHRDYKPDNVLVDADGVSKLTDFGIAVRAGDRTAGGGTLAYAPPEQFSGGSASPAGDVYAATATFFECLTGRPPFRGESAAALLYQHVAEPVPVDAVPEPVRPLVAAGMAKHPADRPADAATFVAALNQVAAGAYGPDWADRGRSHLAEAALLLAALWPSGGPAAGAGQRGGADPIAPGYAAGPDPAVRRGQGGHRDRRRGRDRGYDRGRPLRPVRLLTSPHGPRGHRGVSGQRYHRRREHGDYHRNRPGPGRRRPVRRRTRHYHLRFRHPDHRDQPAQNCHRGPDRDHRGHHRRLRQADHRDRRRHRGHHRDHPVRHLEDHCGRPLHLHRPAAGGHRRGP